MLALETGRLRLRELGDDDAAFILRLLNEPSWLENIGDRGARSIDDARDYIRNGPQAMYARLGFGLMCVELKESGACIGLCGLLRRDALEHPDIGFAFLPEYWRRGYASESAVAVLQWASRKPGMDTVLAVVAPHNQASAQLLLKLGFEPDGVVCLSSDGKDLHRFAVSLRGPIPWRHNKD